MKKFVFIILFIFSISVSAQKNIEIGLVYGNSHIFRQNSHSHYNYANAEYGFFLGKNLPWKYNFKEKKLQIFWALQSNFHLGKYTFYVDDFHQNIYKINALGGIKLTQKVGSSQFVIKALLGPGYNTGYHQRLEKGIYMTEQLITGIEIPISNKMNGMFNLGIKHISNANIYQLNRGAEVFFIQLGIIFL